MDAALLKATREERGLALAKTSRIKKEGDLWIVPSQSNPGSYVVRNVGDVQQCTCPDWQTRQLPCKHVYAVEFARQSHTASDGSTTITETMKVTYGQNWRPYRQARRNEKEDFENLLRGLCDGIDQPSYKGNGRPALPLSDVIYSAVHTVYTLFSSDREQSDLRALKARGLLTVVPSPNTILRAMREPETVQILRRLIEESALPLKQVEVDFAPDATGIARKRYVRWFDKKWGKEKREKTWLKLHLIVGVKTMIVTAAEVTPGNQHDSPFLPALVSATAKNFTMREVLADKGYLGRENFSAIVKAGAEPFIPFKPNSKPSKSNALWTRLHAYYTFNREEFLAHYHMRSLSEAAFSSMKRVLSSSVDATSFQGGVNEVYAKVLCHNLRMLVHANYELGIEPTFYSPSLAANDGCAP